jgi:hypothetical protein
MGTDGMQPARLSTAHSRELGEELRQARNRAGMSTVSVTDSLGWSIGKLSKLETGTRATSQIELAALLGRCGTDRNTRERILAIAAEGDVRSFVRPHNGCPDSLLALSVHERIATSIMVYDTLTVPSIAQTEKYAYALTGSESVVRARMRRHELFRRANNPSVHVYIHEAALLQGVGSPEVMHDQFLHLALMGGWDGTDVRVIPRSAHHELTQRYPAALFTFPHPFVPMGYTETDTATVFHDSPLIVSVYQDKMRQLEALALSAIASRDLIMRWADTYERSAV